MQQTQACVESLEGGVIASNNIIRPFYVHCQTNEVVDVAIGCASWLDVNFNDQIEAFCKLDQVI